MAGPEDDGLVLTPAEANRRRVEAMNKPSTSTGGNARLLEQLRLDEEMRRRRIANTGDDFNTLPVIRENRGVSPLPLDPAEQMFLGEARIPWAGDAYPGGVPPRPPVSSEPAGLVSVPVWDAVGGARDSVANVFNSDLRSPDAIVGMDRPGFSLGQGVDLGQLAEYEASMAGLTGEYENWLGPVNPGSTRQGRAADAARLDAQAMSILLPDYVNPPPVSPAPAPAPAGGSSIIPPVGVDPFDEMFSGSPRTPAAFDRGRGLMADTARLNAQAIDSIVYGDSGAPAPSGGPAPADIPAPYAGLSYDDYVRAINRDLTAANRLNAQAEYYGAQPGAPAAPTVPVRGNQDQARRLQDQMVRDINASLAGMDLSNLDFSGVSSFDPTAGRGAGDGRGAGGGDGSGAGSGAGGGSGGGLNWAQLLEQQRQEAVAMRARLEDEYQSRRDELVGMFQFAETDEERAQIAFLMAELQDATDVAYDAIAQGYSQATETAILLGERARRGGEVESQAVEDLFLQAGQRISDITGQTVEQSGIGRGLVGGQALQSANDFMQLVVADAAREAALSRRMGGIVAEDFEMFQGRLAAQEMAQQAALARESRASGTMLQAQHNAAVQQRIAEDRRRLVQELQQLQGKYADLGYNYDAQALGAYGTAATLAQRDAQAAADRANSLALQRMRSADELAMIENERAYQRSLEPEWQSPELAQAVFTWNNMTDIQRATPGVYESLFSGLLPGVADPETVLTPSQQAAADRLAGQAAAGAGGLVSLTDEEILRRAAELEEEAAAQRRADADRIREETAERIRNQTGYSNYYRNP